MATPTIEEYLEAIYVLSDEGQLVIGARLAETLEISPPTVTATLRRMNRDGLIELRENKEIMLTAKGRGVAEALLRRHRLSERWLTDVLGLDWHKAHAEACKLEHAISAEVEKRLRSALGNPATCPHGNPITGMGILDETVVRLDHLPAGSRAIVRRISEQAESSAELMRFLEEKGLIPGAVVRLLESVPFAGSMTVQVGDQGINMAPHVASFIWVEPIEGDEEKTETAGTRSS